MSEKRGSGIVWRIVISTVGVALILIAVVNLLLFFFGDTAFASVSTRRVGGADDNRPVNQRYEWSLDYTFLDQTGTTRNGHMTRRGSDLSVKTDARVYYFPFAPFINTLESEAKPNLSQPMLVIIGVFLIYAVNKKTKQSIP